MVLLQQYKIPKDNGFLAVIQNPKKTMVSLQRYKTTKNNGFRRKTKIYKIWHQKGKPERSYFTYNEVEEVVF